MPRHRWLTPEEMKRKQDRNKKLRIAVLILAIILLSAILTLLENKI
ncbi:hypothetical protein [Heyndrickxia acidicola]|uniref:Uncharacterized protein n=1 Tax=Heyndrickxia acidicola TaxID=209389 RepID=A0ABU6MGB0_9BACI|nr:hypothetical protein [Heyndrickxia acidicola]MED1203716.1 hypothetical protein [Heyndrickxia acidicola]